MFATIQKESQAFHIIFDKVECTSGADILDNGHGNGRTATTN